MKIKNNINSLINEEISHFLNESISMEHDNFKFRQELNNSIFYNYDGFSTDFDTNIEKSDIFINWHIIFWVNDSGVENFIISVDSVEGTYTLNLHNRQTDVLEQTNDKNIAEIPWKFKVGKVTLVQNGGLYVQNLEFDFKSNTCNVGF